MPRWMRSPLIMGIMRARPGKDIPRHDGSADRIGDQRAGGDAAHAELRDRAEPEAERAAENDLADGGTTAPAATAASCCRCRAEFPPSVFISQGMTAPPKNIWI